MKKCTDPQFQDMIHGFELGILSEEDRLGFEEHLLDCDFCFDQVRAFLPAALLLRHDREIRTVERNTWVRPLLAIAAALVLLALPTYWYGIRDTSTPDVVQRLVLTSVRGGTPPVLYLEEGGQAEIVFRSETADTGQAYHVVVSTRDGESIVYENQWFLEFDSLGAGRISLPLSDFAPGFYVLSVMPRSEDSALYRQLYNFRVR